VRWRATAIVTALPLLLALGPGGPEGAEAAVVRAVVADLPYARVWEAAVRAMTGFPIERAGDGVIVALPRERPARPEEGAFARVAERVVVRVEPFGERITRVSVEVEVSGLRDGVWVPIPDGDGATARAILDRLEAEQARDGGRIP
jgi:hypothetical protein